MHVAPSPKTNFRFLSTLLPTLLLSFALFGLTAAPVAAQVPEAPKAQPVKTEAAKPAVESVPVDLGTNVEAGEKLADEGRDAYRAGRYADAIALFEKAYPLSTKPAYLYNIARAKEKVADYDGAIKYLEKYLEAYKHQNAGAEPQNAADVKNLMRDFKQRAFEAMPEVIINSVPPGAQVYLSATDGLMVEAANEKGALIGSTPVSTHLKPGTYNMTLQLINHVDHRAELQVPTSGKLNLAIAMKIKQTRSGLAIWSNIKGAQVAVDGKVVAVTPYMGVLPMQPGTHQVTLTRVGFHTADQQVTLSEDKLTTVRMNLKPSAGPPASWRSFTGWPLLILGGLAIGGGYAAAQWANQEYAGTEHFLYRQKLQNYGYYGGGAAVGLGLGLIIWDWTRSAVNTDDLAPGPYLDDGVEEKPLPTPESP
jgi:hypothetical protein